MSRRDKEDSLESLANSLTAEFQRWDYLYKYGGSDPFYADGTNLNLVRNHIIYYKRQIDDYFREKEAEPSLFTDTYPDIYRRETPPEVSYQYMANEEAIRTRAREQMALYKEDPNFQYLLKHHEEVFGKGETKATKAAGLYATISASLIWLQRYIEEDDLISMRRIFYEDYEKKAERWADAAGKMKAFLDMERTPEDDLPAPIEYEEDEIYDQEESSDLEIDLEEDPVVETTQKKLSLEEQITNAKQRFVEPGKKEPEKELEEQLSFF